MKELGAQIAGAGGSTGPVCVGCRGARSGSTHSGSETGAHRAHLARVLRTSRARDASARIVQGTLGVAYCRATSSPSPSCPEPTDYLPARSLAEDIQLLVHPHKIAKRLRWRCSLAELGVRDSIETEHQLIGVLYLRT